MGSSCVDGSSHSSGGGGDGVLTAASAATNGTAADRPTEFRARQPLAPTSDAGVETLREVQKERDSTSSTATPLTATVTTAEPAEAEHETADATAVVAAAGAEEAGLDMSDFEDLLLDHLKTSDYPAGEYIFRSVSTYLLVFLNFRS